MDAMNITEERLDEIIAQAIRVYSTILLMSYEFEKDEIFILISIIMSKYSEEFCQGNEEELFRNLEYVQKLLIKKSNSIKFKEQ